MCWELPALHFLGVVVADYVAGDDCVGFADTGAAGALMLRLVLLVCLVLLDMVS